MKIRIVKASEPTYWYADKIGEVFEVVSEGVNCNTNEPYYVIFDEDREDRMHVYKADCEEVIEHNSQLYRKVDRPVREGDTVLITKFANEPVNLFRTVVENKDYSSFFDVNEFIDDDCKLVFKNNEQDEYSVLEAIKQPVQPYAPTYAEISELLHEASRQTRIDKAFDKVVASNGAALKRLADSDKEDIVEHNSQLYRKVNRKADIGDLIVVVEDFGYGKIGEIHTVKDDDHILCGITTDKAPLMNHSRYLVLEPIESTPTLTETDLIANLAQEVASLKKDLHHAQSDIADLEDRLDESEKDTEELVGRINDLGDGAEAAAVVSVEIIEKVIAELEVKKSEATLRYSKYENMGEKELAQFYDGKELGFKTAIRKIEEALRNG
ncbi:hypothetical protein ACFU1R_20450 [Priestia megaterium]|uniref:hypothetical protein n=1 Tax=Priestia megaterium TaxID=1404 RepID=UPI00366EE102